MWAVIAALRASVTDTTVSTSRLGDAYQRQRVPGEARSAEARARMQELAADPPVQPDAARHVVHVRADPL